MNKWYSIENKAESNSVEISIYDEIGDYGTSAKDFIEEVKNVKFEDAPANPVVEKQPKPPDETPHRTNPNIPKTPNMGGNGNTPPKIAKRSFTFASRPNMHGRRGR